MHDAAATTKPEDNLSKLVHEAFIEPIRSVLIIDDRYPTWEMIFSDPGYDSKNTKWADRDKILEVVSQFRAKSPAMTVDIHDGANNANISSYLHQSDLLVLDFQLESVAPFGVLAAGILRRLLSSTHFNLVVLHTETDDLIGPFNRILLSLLPPFAKDPVRLERAQKVVEDAEENISDDIQTRLANSVEEADYLAFRRALDKGVTSNDFMETSDAAAEFRAICDEAKWKPGQRRLMWCWTLAKHETNMTGELKEKSGFKWKAPDESDWPWIRSSGGFVAFAVKQNTELLDILRRALEDWKPSPSRMISSRIRAEISASGVMAEDTTFSDRRAHWKYYQELLATDASGDAGDSHRRTLVEAHAARHAERLLDKVGAKAVEFGLRVVKCDPTAADPDAEGFSSHYDVPPQIVGEPDVALNHYNAYISTKAVSGWHLQPGHIIDVDRELWVCVSPACDLVPKQKGQIGISFSTKSATKPFLAVKLHTRPSVERADVNSNTMVFLRDEARNEVSTYSVFPTKGEHGSPVWRMMFAGDHGQFKINEDKTADIKLQTLSGESGELKIKPADARIVAQLRYEYALNLVNKLGVEFTRIGLDFVAPPAAEETNEGTGA